MASPMTVNVDFNNQPFSKASFEKSIDVIKNIFASIQSLVSMHLTRIPVHTGSNLDSAFFGQPDLSEGLFLDIAAEDLESKILTIDFEPLPNIPSVKLEYVGTSLKKLYRYIKDQDHIFRKKILSFFAVMVVRMVLRDTIIMKDIIRMSINHLLFHYIILLMIIKKKNFH